MTDQALVMSMCRAFIMADGKVAEVELFLRGITEPLEARMRAVLARVRDLDA